VTPEDKAKFYFLLETDRAAASEFLRSMRAKMDRQTYNHLLKDLKSKKEPKYPEF